MGLACSGTDAPVDAAAGRSSGAGSPGVGGSYVAGTGAGGGSAGTVANGGTVGVAGSATAGAPPATAGTGGSVAVAGGSNAAGASSAGATGSGGAGSTKWVGTWTASPYATASDGQPPAALANSVLRQVTHASLGGNKIRVQYSNKQGTQALVIKSAHVALCKATPLVDGSIDTATDKALAFGGMAGVSIPAGMEMWSDAVDFALPALGNVSITTAFGTVPSDLTSHNGARTDSYVQTNSSDVSVANMSSAAKNQHWFFIAGMDVMAPMDAKGIVAIGDSITDGRGVTPNANNRWTDLLAARLQKNAATANVSIMNQGIGATNLSGGGTAAEARFARDVLSQSGVKYAIIFDGVNDINGGATSAAMKATYDKLIKAGRDKSLLVYGATILPFGGNAYWTDAHEKVRTEVNAYIKGGAFDGYIDFEAAVTDGKTGNNAPSLLASTKSADQLHPGPEGYQMMADKVDLTLFTK